MKRRADDEPENASMVGGTNTTLTQTQETPAETHTNGVTGVVGDGTNDVNTMPPETTPTDNEQKPTNYRTRRCMRWAHGSCHLGESCTFLHSGELGTHFPCRNFLNGYCPRGRLCDFKHDYSLLPPFGGTMMPFHPGVVMPPPAKKSSALCRHFEKGYCSLGIACGFQHPPPGTQPTGAVANLPANAKTTQCRHFEKGFCNLGENCGFAHGDKEGSAKPVVPVAAPPSNICRHYERGYCRLGQTCGFQHPGYVPPATQHTGFPPPAQVPHPGYAPPAPQPPFDPGFPPRAFTPAPEASPYASPYSTPPAPAFYPYSYPVPPPTLPVRPSPPPLASPPRRQTECRHWAKGYCQLNNQCGFLHTPR